MVNDEFVNEIIDLARKAYDFNEVPVGAIVVCNGKIIGRGYNNKEKSHLITGHAEIMAINEACLCKNDWRLDDCDLYVTLKPCMMCSGAIEESRIKNVFYLCDRTNVCNNIFNDNYYNIGDNKNKDIYINLLRLFFENRRI